MSSIVRRPRKAVDSAAIHCSNCTFFFKGICKKLDEISGGTHRYISNKKQAKNCKYFKRKADRKKSQPLIRSEINNESPKQQGDNRPHILCKICNKMILWDKKRGDFNEHLQMEHKMTFEHYNKIHRY